ncbi:maleate cis-trans isomerase family protein [Rhodovulum sp. DZ06]|uniref:maleate cis-trans isomerase family protein n=1 Tax=Rhodovulum sp. DZ06 TaxID=3425126 RepID=UPI003D343AFB
MTRFPYSLDAAPVPRAFGLVVLQVDETIEPDFRRLMPAGAALYVSRVPSGAELMPETIAGMEADLPRAAALLPQAPDYDAVGYACTSGTAQLGAGTVEALVRGACRTARVCNPLTAAVAACGALGAARVGVVSPYIPAVAAPLLRAFAGAGIETPQVASFGEEVEANVARIDAASVAAAARSVAQGAEAVFLSCTNLRTLDLVGPLEAELGVPVFGSNLALAWAMAGRDCAFDCALTRAEA